MEKSRARVHRSVAEKRRIVELTLEPGASVATVARSEGVNANQVFEWRRAYHAGRLAGSGEGSSALLPVMVSQSEATEGRGRRQQRQPSVACGSIHIEVPGQALISVESGADAELLRTILEVLSR